MQVTVQDINPVKKLLCVELPADVVNVEFDAAYKKIKKTAKVKGFRPGKVPQTVLESMFKKNVCDDVKSKLVQDTLFEAVTKADLAVIGEPIINPPELDERGPFKYEVLFEVKPKISDLDFTGLTIQKNIYTPTPEEADEQIKKHQQDLVTHEPITEERPVKEGDIVAIDYEVFKDGKPFEDVPKAEDTQIKIGEGQISPEIDSQLVEAKPGDYKEIQVSFPENHLNPSIAGLEIDFHITIKSILKEILPPLDDEFAKKVGKVDTLDALKDKIFNNLQEGYRKRTEHEMNEQIFESLLSQVEFQTPDVMVDYEIESMLAEAGMAFSQSGLPEEQLQKLKETFADRFRETAVKQVERHLILDKIINQEKVALSEEELEDGFKQISESNLMSIEDIKKFYEENKDKLELYKHTLLEQKAIKLILDQNTIEEIAVEKPEQPEEEINI